jgi:hypothetical protein
MSVKKEEDTAAKSVVRKNEKFNVPDQTEERKLKLMKILQ